MEFRFFRDRETGEAHVLEHGVTEAEIREAFDNLLEDGGGDEASRVLIGRTEAGRYLRVVYSPDPVPESVFRDHRLSTRPIGDARAAS